MSRYQQNTLAAAQHGGQHRQGAAQRDHPRHREPRAGDGQCPICSYSQDYDEPQVPIYHRHFSSVRLRMQAEVENTTNPYLCPSCKIQHIPYPQQQTWSGQDRIKIVVSDSTLHTFFTPPRHQYHGDRIHVDYITIAGGDIEALTRAFWLDYVDKPHKRPLDVAVVAGYNNLVIGHSRDHILHMLNRFTDLVKLAGLNLHPDNPNTVAISTFMLPPQLAWFADNGPYPYPGYINQKEKIDWLNREIHDLNLGNNVVNYVGLHTYGVRKDTKTSYDRYGQTVITSTRRHRYEHWRETDKGNMLHLRDDRRFKMGTALNNYFIHNT